MVSLLDVWLQLGWCIISLRWWSFHNSAGDARLSWRCQTQMEMPAECACMRRRHTRHTPNTAYISSWMYLYFRIQASNNQYISSGCEPGYRYNLNLTIFLWSCSRSSTQSLKNPKPCHCSNSLIESTKTQHHHEQSPRSYNDFFRTRF